MQTKLFAREKGSFYSHTLTLSLSVFYLVRYPRPRYCPIRLFIPFVYSLVGWFLVGQPKDPYHIIDRPFHTVCLVCTHTHTYRYGCYGRLSLLFHYVFVVHVQRILGNSTHKKGMPKWNNREKRQQQQQQSQKSPVISHATLIWYGSFSYM